MVAIIDQKLLICERVKTNYPGMISEAKTFGIEFMGMLIQGAWSDEDEITKDGAYVRPASSLRKANTSRTILSIQQNPGRYWLIASRSCPWSHRAVIVHFLKQLDAHIPIQFAHGKRIEGYALDDGENWRVPGSSEVLQHLHELYTIHDAHYTGRVTVPVLWDSRSQTIVSNESSDIVRALDALTARVGKDFTIRPKELVSEIDAANELVYHGLNNAVYRAGFAQTQNAYEKAVALVFETLDALEQRLSSLRYYFGDTLTETDIRIFPTLVRFDAIYYILFKCCRRRLIDYPNLWNYARDLYCLRGFANSIDFRAMREASYLADTRDPHPIIALEPDADWTAEHNRAALSDACLLSPIGEKFKVAHLNVSSAISVMA